MFGNLTKVADLTPQKVREVLDLAAEYQKKHREGVRLENVLDGKVVALVFEKPSLRTKVAFEVATLSLKGNPVFLSSSQILASGQNQKGRESIPDIARNLERFADLIVARVYSHQVIQDLVQSVKIPVINALCDSHHPTQALADVMAVLWHKKTLKGLKVAFIGDGNNVATSLMQISAMMGMDFSIASPAGYELPEAERTVAARLAKESGSSVLFTRVPEDAIKNADVVYADTFVSMGQESEQQKRQAAFKGYQVNSGLMAKADKNAIFLHCLPAHRGEEVTDEVMDSRQSVVFDQAECRLHIAKALLTKMLA